MAYDWIDESLIDIRDNLQFKVKYRQYLQCSEYYAVFQQHGGIDGLVIYMHYKQFLHFQKYKNSGSLVLCFTRNVRIIDG